MWHSVERRVEIVSKYLWRHLWRVLPINNLHERHLAMRGWECKRIVTWGFRGGSKRRIKIFVTSYMDGHYRWTVRSYLEFVVTLHKLFFWSCSGRSQPRSSQPLLQEVNAKLEVKIFFSQLSNGFVELADASAANSATASSARASGSAKTAGSAQR